jgi:hypothetical protein
MAPRPPQTRRRTRSGVKWETLRGRSIKRSSVPVSQPVGDYTVADRDSRGSGTNCYLVLLVEVLQKVEGQGHHVWFLVCPQA